MTSDPLVLGFDTSAAHCVAVLLRGDDVLSQRHEEMARGQAERLMPMLEDMLTETDVGWKALDALGVGIGPGNFTGVRISVSAARGLALGLGIPAVGVSLLEAVALGSEGPVLAALDARRGMTYLQMHGRGEVADWGPELAQIEAIAVRRDIPPGTIVIGGMAEAVAAKVGGVVRPAHFAPGLAIARIAIGRFRNVVPRPAPLYLRSPDAAPPREAPPAILP